MKFKKLTDLIQYFANEYCKPMSKILIIGNTDFKQIFSSINSEVFYINTTQEPGVDIVVSDYKNLPFEDYSFDLIINFTDIFDLFHLTNGTILTKGEILNGNDYYEHNKIIYTVLT